MKRRFRYIWKGFVSESVYSRTWELNHSYTELNSQIASGPNLMGSERALPFPLLISFSSNWEIGYNLEHYSDLGHIFSTNVGWLQGQLLTSQSWPWQPSGCHLVRNGSSVIPSQWLCRIYPIDSILSLWDFGFHSIEPKSQRDKVIIYKKSTQVQLIEHDIHRWLVLHSSQPCKHCHVGIVLPPTHYGKNWVRKQAIHP